MPTRIRTRSIALSAAFVGLTAGGTAACDSAPDTVQENHTFYCTTQDGTVVDEDQCDDDGDGHGGSFFLWHSSSSTPALRPGQKVPAGGSSIKFNDKAGRTSWGLPATGRVNNGSSVKVGVVGKGGAPVGAGGGAKAGG